MSWIARIEEQGIVPASGGLYEVRSSGIEGVGTFALQRLPEQFTLGAVRGLRYLAAEHDSDTCVVVNDEWVMEPSLAGVPVHFINHSCQPNCVVGADPDDDTEVIVETLRVIPAGEELTIDYAWDVPPPFLPCRCGSPYCRGWVASSSALQAAGLLDAALL